MVVGLDMVMVAGLDLIILTLHEEATTVLALSEARQNISKPWPYLTQTEDKTITDRLITNYKQDSR